MEEEKKTCITWIKEHKKELLIAGVSVSAIILAIIGLKNQKVLDDVKESLKILIEKSPEESLVLENVSENLVPEIDKVTKNRNPYDVPGFVRKLPIGQKASAEKLAQAAELGIILPEGKTFVNSYHVGGVAA